MKFRVKWNKDRKDIEVDPSGGVGALKQAVNDAFGTLLAFRFLWILHTACMFLRQAFPLRDKN